MQRSVGVSLGSGLVLLMGWLSGQQELQLALQLGATAAIGGLLWRNETEKTKLRTELSSLRDEVDAAQRGVRLVLDHIDQGLLMVAPDGRVAPERSLAARRLLGGEPTMRLWELLPGVGEPLKRGWKRVFEGDLSLEELPSRCEVAGRTLRLSYVPVHDEGRLMSVLVVLNEGEARMSA